MRHGTSETSDKICEVNLGVLEDLIGYHLRMAQEAAFLAFAREAGLIDLKPGHFSILELIDKNPGITQTVLGKANGRNKSSLTPVLDELVRNGFVQRQRVEGNRRAYSLTLTQSGRGALRRLLNVATRHEQRMARIVGQKNVQRLVQLLNQLTSGLAEE